MQDPVGLSTTLDAARDYEEARLRAQQANWTGAHARFRRVLEYTEATGETAWRAEVLWEMARMYHSACDIAAARRYYREAIAAAGDSRDPDRPGEAWLRLAQVEHIGGNLDEALACLEQSLAVAEGPAARGTALAARGAVAWDCGRESEALRDCATALSLLAEVDPVEAADLRGRLREYRQRTGRVRFRSLLTHAGLDPSQLDLEG